MYIFRAEHLTLENQSVCSFLGKVTYLANNEASLTLGKHLGEGHLVQKSVIKVCIQACDTTANILKYLDIFPQNYHLSKNFLKKKMGTVMPCGYMNKISPRT